MFAKANGIEISKDVVWQVNLPPGIIEKAAEQLGLELDNGSISKLENEIQVTNEQNRIKMKQEELMKAQKFPMQVRSPPGDSSSETEGVGAAQMATQISND